MLVFEELVNCLFLLIDVVKLIMVMKQHLINLFFQKLQLKNKHWNWWKKFLWSRIQLNNTMTWEKHQQDKVMITQFVIRFGLFWKKLQINCGWFKQTKSFRWRSKSNLIRIYYILKQSKETVLEFANGTASVVTTYSGWIQKSKC